MIVPLCTAQTTGTCETPTAVGELDVGNVQTSVFAYGGAGWGPTFNRDPPFFEVPKGEGANAVFTSVFWIGGMVDGDLRISAARYGRFQFWTGPLDESGAPPTDCATFDRIWKINKSEIVAFEVTGIASTDLREWPTGLGAPTLSPTNRDGSSTASDGIDNDLDGLIDEAGELRSITDDILTLPLTTRINRVINLDAGERPDILGDQMLWWIMNDAGNEHLFWDLADTFLSYDPIGLEVHASAFAFGRTGDLGNTVFYRYRLINRSSSSLDEAFVGMYVDPDLGSFDDDYVGSDTTLGIGIVYNADNDDDARYGGYGLNPPALAYDFLQGPIVASPTDSALVSGQWLNGFRRIKMTSFQYYNGGGCASCDPQTNVDHYRYM
ncbi:MAG: hypothetical protein HKN13_15385, partial [Rhodothermales bacterium]|nr:hypothetical protein [Rhodothermales bacterium]